MKKLFQISSALLISLLLFTNVNAGLGGGGGASSLNIWCLDGTGDIAPCNSNWGVKLPVGGTVDGDLDLNANDIIDVGNIAIGAETVSNPLSVNELEAVGFIMSPTDFQYAATTVHKTQDGSGVYPSTMIVQNLLDTTANDILYSTGVEMYSQTDPADTYNHGGLSGNFIESAHYGSGTLGSVFGADIYSTNASSGDVTRVQGMNIAAESGGTSSTVQLYGLQSTARLSGTSPSVDKSIAGVFSTIDGSTGGSITDSIGVQIEEVDIATDDNINLLIGDAVPDTGDYSIYSGSTKDSYFA